MEHILEYTTYSNLNTDHNWNYEDTVIIYYLSRLKSKLSKYEDYKTIFNWDVVSDYLHEKFGLTLSTIAEDLIGCSLGAIYANVAVVDYLITGIDKGFKNPNRYQIQIVKDFENKSIEQIENIINKTFDKYWLDEERLKNNAQKKRKREQDSTLRKNKKLARNKKAEEIKHDLKKSNISLKSKPLDKYRNSSKSIKIGTRVKHDKFGNGVVTSGNETFSNIDFNGVTKKLINSYIKKITI